MESPTYERAPDALPLLQRFWVNQPSIHQPMHALHGTNLLGHAEPHAPQIVRAYFLSGSMISQQIPRHWLSVGWLNEKDQEHERIQAALDDHQIALIVNQLRDTAIDYHSTQQLRDRIAHIIVPYLRKEKKE